MSINNNDAILFFLTDSDLAKSETIRKTVAWTKVYEWYYTKRVNDLNEMLDSIAHSEYLDGLK